MGDVLLLALAAAFNPTLVAASTLMMLLPRPAKLMLGYLLGALMTSITLGVVIVFSVENSGVVSTTKHTLSPAATIALGALALIGGFVLVHGGRHRRPEARTAGNPAKGQKRPPGWQRALGKGSPRITFVVGALLTLPGASYLAGLSRIDKLGEPNAVTVLLIVAFNLIMLALLEISLMSFVIAPEWTPKAIDRARAWGGRHAHRIVGQTLAVLGALLVVKGSVELLSQ